ncbi:MAG: glycerophosphodiester phosphodiesterase [Micromonosporaceae bacterium]|nr:glycerophosphodiester phosphodiesterase [Micromonosporaceae bacterium]
MSTPLVFAHRGSSAAEPEHTLAAYLRALAEGADGLECDVRLTRDGHLVCLHDRRLERTSNGRGLVSRSTLAELSQLDFGSWHPTLPGARAGRTELTDDADDAGWVSPGTPPARPGSQPPSEEQAEPDRGRLLTLDRLLTAVCAAGQPVRLLVETKHPTRYGGDVERRLLALLDRHGLADPGPADPVRVSVMSFSPLALRRIRELAPGLPTVLLLELLPPALRLGRLPFGTRVAGPGIGLLRRRPAVVETLRAAGNDVYVWTVNEPDDLELVCRLGVDAIITDRPRFVLDHLRG